MKKAFAWLEGNGIEFRFHDYKKSGIAPERVKQWLKQARWDDLVNTKGLTFRQLAPGRRQGLNAANAAELMIELPGVIKRPVLEAGKALLIGFDPERYRAALGKSPPRA
ncbi:MAG: Spx/MgsR family RNA polymerase-binding regulatory protein [Burkholderiales bacterium]|nr:Spx/MgsR family RNA polymerase-binding regulatory protein [Burkholderiales bacterium]